MSILNFFKPKFNTATEEIKWNLVHRGKIDQDYCNKHRITSRLGGFIWILRRQGMDITTEMKEITTRYNEKTRIAIYHYKK